LLSRTQSAPPRNNIVRPRRQTQLQPIPQTALPSDADIRQMLVDRIDIQQQSVGIVVVLSPRKDGG